MARLDWARRAVAAGTAAGALFAPLAVEAGRRGRGTGGRAGHGVRDYWDNAGDGGNATASANGGSFVFGDIRTSSSTDSEAQESAGDVSAEKNGNNNNHHHRNNNGNNNTNDTNNANGHDGNPVGGHAGDAAARLREYADKLTGANHNNANGGNNAGDTGTNISYDPDTGAFGYDNGNIAYIHDADGSSFYQTGNITFEVGSGATLDTGSSGGGGSAGGGGGGGGGGGNNGGGGGFNS